MAASSRGFTPYQHPWAISTRAKPSPKIIDPIKGPLVCEAFSLYATGDYSFDILRHELQQRGLSSKTGKPLSMSAIAAILHNPFYVGIMRIVRTGRDIPGSA